MLLQVGFVNAGERFGENDAAAEVARLKCGVFAS